MGKMFISDVKKDKVCECIRCKEEYVFTVAEQRFYEEKHLNPPKRCKMCRTIHKREMELLNINGRGMYYGLSSMTPGLYKGHFKGGIDVTDISGTKYKCKAYYGF